MPPPKLHGWGIFAGAQPKPGGKKTDNVYKGLPGGHVLLPKPVALNPVPITASKGGVFKPAPGSTFPNDWPVTGHPALMPGKPPPPLHVAGKQKLLKFAKPPAQALKPVTPIVKPVDVLAGLPIASKQAKVSKTAARVARRSANLKAAAREASTAIGHPALVSSFASADSPVGESYSDASGGMEEGGPPSMWASKGALLAGAVVALVAVFALRKAR